MTELLTDPRHAPAYVYRGTLAQQLLGLFSANAVATDYPVNLIDISAWQGDMDFSITKQHTQGVYIRAGYGEGYTDKKLEANRAGASAVGLPFGLYWFCYAGYSVQAHVDGFYNAWKSAPGNLPPVLDFEWTNLDKANTTLWVAQLVSAVKSKFGVAPMIYTSPGWWNSWIGVNSWDYLHDLWVAHWTTASAPIIPNNWRNQGRTWRFWQHSAEGNGKGQYYGSTNGDADMDEDRFNGTLAQFYAYAGVTPPPVQQVVKVKISAPAGVKVDVEVVEI